MERVNICKSIVHLGIVLGGTSSLVVGCASSPMAVKSITVQEETPSTEVCFYPNNQQSEQTQERDRYECYLWAVGQTGFDPGQQNLAPHQRIEVVSTTLKGSDIAVGAATGAVFGSIIGGRHARAEGLVFGTLAGMIVGLTSELSKQENANALQEQYDEMEKQRYNQLEKQANSYKRAMSACLEGRGYTVKY